MIHDPFLALKVSSPLITKIKGIDRPLFETLTTFDLCSLFMKSASYTCVPTCMSTYERIGRVYLIAL